MPFQEFSAFLHPEDAEHMRDIVVQETLEDIDKDGDGHVGIVLIPTKKIICFLQVNIDEYIGDMYRDEGGEDGEHGIFLYSVCIIVIICFNIILRARLGS